MDKTVEEFNKAIEESGELSGSQTKTRRGRIIHPPNLDLPGEPKIGQASGLPSTFTKLANRWRYICTF